MDPRVDKLIEVVRKTVIMLFPELTGRYHLAARAKVTGVANGISAQPLTRERTDDDTSPVVKCPALPYTLKPDNVIHIGYLYGDPSEPMAVVLSTAAIGTWTGGKVTVEGYGARDGLVMEYLKDHFRLATLTAPVDQDGNPLPGATTSPLTRIDFRTGLKDGDKVAAVPIEEGDRFIVIGKL
ncbi:hypothetical protein [Pelotomaculum propionicicum]|uniref:Uncharacterized protein n=1 Tax=Pelotomaculum propionicicum TaxID=258475 RepID=A0A4Y7RJG1_9FIRM|nr:hypothetical protein [Pelotomaculum propionicicum]TEB09134.1 hypothetical protein Pmgp_03355 [Pelotomaculum propionicicum]